MFFYEEEHVATREPKCFMACYQLLIQLAVRLEASARKCADQQSLGRQQEMLYRGVDQSAPPSFASIAGIEFTQAVAAGLAQDKIATPTNVQLAAIGPILAGHNVVIESGTGTGKTLAYLLPILQKLRLEPTTRAVCFAPATELAVQTMRVAERYKEPELKTAALVATGNQRLQASRLEKSTRLIVGTPGRILEMYEKRKLKGVNVVVLDEPEPILASRDADYLCEVLSRPEPKLQIVIAGATYGSNAEKFVREFMGSSVVRTKVTDDPLRSQIEHLAVKVRNEGEKDFVLARFLAKHQCKRAIVFVNHPNLTRHLYRYLIEQGVKTVTVSHERTKLQCEQAMRDFSKGSATVLLTTDQAATGIDVADVEWVLHFELPSSEKAYVHRAGRTGRAGKAGKSVVFVSDADRIPLLKLEKSLGFEFRSSGK
jgi:superfamily II DNA/RNA helicase